MLGYLYVFSLNLCFSESVSNLNILLHLHFGLSLNKILYVKEVGVKFNVQQGSVSYLKIL